MEGALVVQSIPSRSPEITSPSRGDPGGQEIAKSQKSLFCENNGNTMEIANFLLLAQKIAFTIC